MADDVEIARRDLAFLRDLVEDSRPMLRPLGAMLALAGVVQCLSALRIWAVSQGWLSWPPALVPWMGADGVIVQLAITVALVRLESGPIRLPKGAASPAARAIRGAVVALAWALTAAALGFAAVAVRLGDSRPLATGFSIVLFALAAATWWVTFAVYRRRWALWATMVSAAFAPAAGLAAETSELALVVGLGLFVCLAAPGIAMMRQANGE